MDKAQVLSYTTRVQEVVAGGDEGALGLVGARRPHLARPADGPAVLEAWADLTELLQ